MVATRKNDPRNITLSMTEFKQQLGELSNRIVNTNATVTVMSHGKSKLMVVSAERGEALLELEQQALKRRIVAEFTQELAQIREEAAQYNSGPRPTDTEIESISVEESREARMQLALETFRKALSSVKPANLSLDDDDATSIATELLREYRLEERLITQHRQKR